MTGPHRVLVVEDHEPFRAVLRRLLHRRGDVQIVGEAADGLDAIAQAEAQRPDVVMLDIGLPTINGLEVADRVRVAVPDAKVMFVTNEPSLEVVEAAFRKGAHGFVYKPRAERDVLRVFDAVIRGGGFVSGGLERIAHGDSLADHHHHVLFYSSDAGLVDVFARFVADALHAGKAVVTVLTPAREQMLRHRLETSCEEFERAVRDERYVVLRVSDVVANVIVDGRVDTQRFAAAAEEVVAMATRRASCRPPRVAAAGECSATVWAQGDVDAALQFERLWDEVATRHQLDTLCAFPAAVREDGHRVVRTLCAQHTVVEIS